MRPRLRFGCAWFIPLGLILLLLLAGCKTEGSVETFDPDAQWTWFYAEGPGGEECLVMEYGSGYSHGYTMSCARVNWP